MKTKKSIFYGLIVAVFTAVFVMPSFAAGGECMDDEKDAIAAPFAMCSTHAYNIGMTKNPDSADRALMKEVIGLKTTFFTQQLYKQYDQLESMVRRLKTQLKKAVLTNNLKAAGAKSEKDDDSSYSGTGSKYIHLAGASDCSATWSNKEKFDCLAKNYDYIKRELNTSSLSKEHRKQLAADYIQAGCTVEAGGPDCKKDSGWKNKTDFNKCFGALNNCIRNGKEAAANAEAARNNPWQQMMKKE